jgi:adhesin transport system membrane fusion protein
MDAERRLFEQRRRALADDVASLQRVLDLARQELQMNEPLLASGDVSKADVLRLQRQVADAQMQLGARRNRYLQEAQSDLARAEGELGGVRQSVALRRDTLLHTELRAPMAGLVKNVRVTTEGAVLRPGEEMLQIVPVEDELIVEARIRPQDIGSLHPGLHTTVKLDAYDYTIYGTLDGTLVYLSPDTLSDDIKPGETPYYRARVRIASPHFKARPQTPVVLTPGMTTTVEVATGSHTVWQYLTKPLTKTLAESMTER